MVRKSRLEKEKKTIAAMMHIYCYGNHKLSGRELCPDCSEMLDYAFKRLDKCKFGDRKPVCSMCPVHCYKPAMRQKVKNVMRYAGPRMIKKHPIMAIDHLIKSLKPGR